MDKKTYYDRLLSDAFHFVNDINFDGAKMGIYKNGETKTYDFDKTNINEIKKVVNEFLKDVQNNYKTEKTKNTNDEVKLVADCETCDNKEVCDALSQEYQYNPDKFDKVDITGEIYPTNYSDSTNIESSKNADYPYTDIEDESVNDLYIEKTEDSKTKISPTTTLKQTFYLISEIYNNSPLFEVHVIDLIDNFAQYIDICRPKYKSAIINIEDKSGGNLILAKKDTIPIIFESSYLETFNESTLYSINEFYKYGREIYLYNPITLRFYCISSGNNDESGLPELDIEKYGFKKASKVEESLLFEYSKTKW